MQSSQNLELVMMGVIERQLWSANKRLLTDPYSLPIRDDWQTVHKICKQFAIYFCWQAPDVLYKRATILHCSKACRRSANKHFLKRIGK